MFGVFETETDRERTEIQRFAQLRSADEILNHPLSGSALVDNPLLTVFWLSGTKSL
jgi:hypothetical protein